MSLWDLVTGTYRETGLFETREVFKRDPGTGEKIKVVQRFNKTTNTWEVVDQTKPSLIGPPEPSDADDIARKTKKITVNDARRRKRDGKLLTYPLDMKSDITDYLEIRVINYKRNGLLNNPGSRAVAENGTSGIGRNNPQDINRLNNVKDLLRVIQLPIPSNVQDGNSVSYESSNLNGIVGGLANSVYDLMQIGQSGIGLNDLGRELQKIIGSASSGLTADVANDLVNKLLVSQAVGVLGGNVTVNQLLAREQGVIFNPNMELLFNGPTLRQFRFSFKMTPRDENESIQIKKIIREFKQSMAPKVVNQEGNSNLFLRTPNIFELRYRQGTGNHPFLHRFKECALTDMSVNYTGEGTYSVYGDSTPVSMIMDLTFKELEPIYDIDYGGDDANGKFVGPGGVGY